MIGNVHLQKRKASFKIATIRGDVKISLVAFLRKGNSFHVGKIYVREVLVEYVKRWPVNRKQFSLFCIVILAFSFGDRRNYRRKNVLDVHSFCSLYLANFTSERTLIFRKKEEETWSMEYQQKPGSSAEHSDKNSTFSNCASFARLAISTLEY